MNDNLETANAPEPGQKWEFNEQVADSFGDMLARSIPGYYDMRDIIYRLGRNQLAQKYYSIADLGASTGDSIAPFIEHGCAHKYILGDISTPMLEKLRERFSTHQGVYACHLDLRKRHDEIQRLLTLDGRGPNLVLAILTLLFVPINFRPNIIRGVYSALQPKGRFIMTEKLQGSDYLVDNILVDAYHQYKNDNGYSWEAIERKRLALEHVQVPLTEQFNMDMLRSAGFQHVEVVHRHLNFATFLAVKES